MKKEISERDVKFQSTLCVLPDCWEMPLDIVDALADEPSKVHDAIKERTEYLEIIQWKQEIYYTQRWLYYSLIMAFTDNHMNVHDDLSKMSVKAYHLTYGLILLPAYSEKLAQMLREFLGIDWDEKETDMNKIVGYLQKEQPNSALKKIVGNYWDNPQRNEVYELARKIKHRWSQHYLGIKTKISEQIEKDSNGNLIKVKFGRKAIDKKVLYENIETLKKANNAFVECAKKVNEEIEKWRQGTLPVKE